ncbi:archaeal ATPase [mine drainage metagenome]|uniref:Archaeal ATPase n=1 Tax=mine drainage metagenome TaxID=410659 RepID=A0A1J5S342_9ZZZZ
MDQIERLITCNDARFKIFFDQLAEDVAEIDAVCNESFSFFTQSIIKPFISSVQIAMLALQDSAADRFHCELVTARKSIKAAEKRYPLHEPNRYVTFKIPMINLGPGIAVDVVAEIDCGEKNQALLLENPEQRLGDIPPGDFALLIPVCIVQSAKQVRMTIQLEWRQLFGSVASYIFDVEIDGQDSTVDWSKLEELEPYSLEVAEGDTFVGRVAKVKSIGNRLLKKPMSSTYITGQKRIGKTSLAHAALEYANEMSQLNDFHYLYLEYGEYCASSPEITVKSLGDNIFNFMQQYLEPGSQIQSPDFLGSLSQLNVVAKLLASQSPSKRFVIVLDEFDEIHPEMYRLGALAETFFANLRTLASRSNLAFILVGGEKMPFIIGAQGDQLNKFVREPLDYFSRSTEWEEYCQLVKKPVVGLLNWDDAAINELFNLTNGHPYYTNLLCSKIVAISVKERDTEIIASDVRHALNVLVSELDTNSFAHMWKDGINAEREQAEVTELKRLRMLVAVGRTLRNNDRSTSALFKNLGVVRLQEHEGAPILEDFLRRDILRDKKGELYCSVPLFEKWLIEIGVTCLIASTLADDLEVELQHAEDAAYVSAGEIQALAELWPLYRSQHVGSEAVRAWLDQVTSFQDQRLLFKLLKNVRFMSVPEIEHKLESAHTKVVRPIVGVSPIEKRTDKRRDIWITYLSGPGKSGLQYARMYAKVNSISTECIVDQATVERRLRNSDENFVKPKVILVVDDVVGSGKTLSEGAVELGEKCGALLTNLSIPIVGIIIISTEDGERKIVSSIKSTKFLPMTLHVCEYVSPVSYAFPAYEIGPWSTSEERDRAKALCTRLGTGLYKDPLGYNGQGLLLVMPDTCPNNSLPILYKTKPGLPNWKALFPRPTT